MPVLLLLEPAGAETYLVSAVTALSAVVVVFWRAQARDHARLERRAAECDRRAAECETRAAALAARLEALLERVAVLERLPCAPDSGGACPPA